MLMVATMVFVSSCLKDNPTTVAPQCAITSFSVGNIQTQLTTKTYDGLADSTYSVTVSGSSIYFNIDQLNGVIASVDSVASWIDISRVIPTVTYTGYIFCRQRGWDKFYSFTSGTDSVDFTQDVEFMVVSTDGENKKTYKAYINKATTTRDSLYWTSQTTPGVLGAHRTAVIGSQLFVFAADANGATVVRKTDGTVLPLVWSEPLTTDVAIDWQSVVVFGNRLYALDASGLLYTSTDGTAWTSVEKDATLTRLLAADALRLYATDGARLLTSTDGQSWAVETTLDIDKLPAAPVSYAAYATNTNASLQNVVLFGLSETENRYAVAWYKLSSADAEIDQPFSYISINNQDDYPMPHLRHVKMVRFGQRLMALGSKSEGEESSAADYFYVSDDNGVSWHRQLVKLVVPQQRDALQDFTLTVCGGRLWLLQADGQVWSGTLSAVLEN